MSDLSLEPLYEQLIIDDDYLEFTLAPRRFRSFRLHLGQEVILDENGGVHCFDLVWFRETEELVAAEVEKKLGVVLPLNFELKKSTGRYLFLGQFTEEGIDDLLPFQGHIIRRLWALYTSEGKVLVHDVGDVQ